MTRLVPAHVLFMSQSVGEAATLELHYEFAVIISDRPAVPTLASVGYGFRR